jgi:glycosyltransferase involved in cell wall biosynthesis
MKNNPKIALLTTSDFPYKAAPESFVRQMALGINQNNLDIEIIRFWGSRHSSKNDTSIKLSNYLFKKPQTKEILKFIEVFFQIAYMPFFVLYRKLIKKDSILLLYGLDRIYIVLPAMLFCKVFNLKIIRIITEIYPSYKYITHWWRKPNVLFYKWQLKYFDRFLDGIIVLSNSLYEICVTNKIDKKRILIIPHFIDLSIPNHSTKKNEKFRVGFCGSPSIENGIIDLITAFLSPAVKQFTNIELIIIGTITPRISEQIIKLNINNDNIHYSGYLKKEELNEELSKCSLLINPRKSGILADTGFPTKLGEYFATKIPVISTKVGDLRQYFTDKNELIFAEPDDPNSLAEAILFAYENKERALEIGLNGYNWASNNLDYMKNSLKLIEFFHQLKYN